MSAVLDEDGLLVGRDMSAVLDEDGLLVGRDMSAVEASSATTVAFTARE